MKNKLDKILIGIEGIIYGAIVIGILITIWDYKYVKICNWKWTLGCIVFGSVIPVLGIAMANILLYKKEKKAIKTGRIVGVLLLPYIIITLVCGFLLEFGGIICSYTDDLKNYKKYDVEVEEVLKGYRDIFPEIDEKGVTLLEYNYKYVRTLDDNFEIKVISQYENTEVMKNKIEQLQKEYGINLVEESGQKKYEYGNCLIWCDETKKEIVYELRESNN